eukprot:CAMPEP_0181232332 /NCGR_PEP_ID=MMETSP1096-20121128/35669_1 /TAXON_ID=156174 ORGANISM="Chrysochromulina ericina, Strain CCMP281" /NCGR_SAMPLE_ID=MMETSP1096 /ASSEMBLY_ACC=CAM_ASM_000453 /LENGTH=110 /DNA_ID=CAMNT_0023326605 /DNA_START=432 /DNA_END=761 /DNA_ORIENTATION=-
MQFCAGVASGDGEACPRAHTVHHVQQIPNHSLVRVATHERPLVPPHVVCHVERRGHVRVDVTVAKIDAATWCLARRLLSGRWTAGHAVGTRVLAGRQLDLELCVRAGLQL